MPYLPLELPPGIYKPGSVYMAKGRWYDSNLIRWYEGNPQPIGGWSEIIAAAAVGSKPVRGMLSWRINSGVNRMMLGTYAKAFVYESAANDVTPSAGFTAGTDTFQSWQFDVFGEDVVACLPKYGATGDGKLWYYDASASSGTAAMTVLDASAPTTNRGVFVTPERFIVALGAGGDPRLIQWADRESISDWTAVATNQAGEFPLASTGTLLRGMRGRGESLVWTTTDLWAMRYVGTNDVYDISQIGSQCGAIGARAMCMVDGKALWMGRNGFYIYDGFVRPLPSEVGDFVFGRQPAGSNLVNPVGAGLDRSLADLVVAVPNTQFGEVTWYYPSVGTSGTGAENDRYVTYNYVAGWWAVGALARTGGVEDGGDTAFGRPILAAPSGQVFMHETPATSTVADWGSTTPYLTSGPIELGEGDRLMMARRYIPDAKALGQWQTTLYTSMYPTGSETTNGPYTSANPTDIRLTARQMRVKVEAVTGSYTHRLGTPRLELVESSGR